MSLKRWLRGGRWRTALIGGGVLALAAIGSALAFSLTNGGSSPEPTPLPEPQPTMDTIAATTAATTPSPTPDVLREASPIDGVLVPVDDFEKAMERLPLAIVFDNHVDSRPAYGLDRAELVYEVVVEAGVTRFLAVYWRNDVEVLMPVRSARVFYLPWTLELDGVFVHFGAATTPGPANVPAQISAYGVRHLDGLVLSHGPFWRDTSRRAPYNAATSSDTLWELAAARGWAGPPSLEPWIFKDDEPERAPPGEAVAEIALSFGPWNRGTFVVNWEYDDTANAYRRSQGGSPQSDGASGQRLTAKNVVVQFVELGFAGDGVHLLYDTVGEGRAVVFQDSIAIEGTWRKPDAGSRTRFYDGEGNEIAFNRGTTWVEVLVDGSALTY